MYVNEFFKITALYAGSILTIITATGLLFKISGTFSSWISTKIVQNADMTKRVDHVSKEEFNRSIDAILFKLEDLSSIRLATKRLEYLNIRQHNPEDEISINLIYDEYKRLGGNSYIDMDYEKWSNRNAGNSGKGDKRTAYNKK